MGSQLKGSRGAGRARGKREEKRVKRRKIPRAHLNRRVSPSHPSNDVQNLTRIIYDDPAAAVGQPEPSPPWTCS